MKKAQWKVKVKNWLLDEESIEKSTETGMWIVGSVAAAIGLVWLITSSIKKSAVPTLERMESTSSSGIDPDVAPAGTAAGWSK